MKKFFVSLLFVLSSVAAAVGATDHTVRSVPNVQLSDARRFVSNPDGILSAEAVYQMDTMLYALRSAGYAEVAVVAVGSIGFEEPRMFAHELFNLWGLGSSKTDNGLLILLAVGQGAVEIEVGYGLEGVMTDALCKRIIENIMIPAFKERNFDGGLVRGVGAICSVLRSDEAGQELVAAAAADQRNDMIGGMLALGTVVIFVVLIMVLLHLNSRCPKCKSSNSLRRSGERILTEKNSFGAVYKVAYRCTKCGHTVWRNENESSGSNTPGGGPIIFGGRGFGGGGFGGGGFGGGMSGGGGAGGRF